MLIAALTLPQARGRARPSLTSLALASDMKMEQEIIMFTATQLYTGELLSSVNMKDNVVSSFRRCRYSTCYDTYLMIEPPKPNVQSISTLLSFFLLLMKHPEAQARAQQEIDEVIGCERLPDYSDRGKLPFVNSIMKEVIRCCPPIPMSEWLDVHT